MPAVSSTFQFSNPVVGVNVTLRPSQISPILRGFFHASLALLATVRAFGARHVVQLKSAVEESLKIIRPFRDGAPDQNTIENLEQALSELPNQLVRT